MQAIHMDCPRCGGHLSSRSGAVCEFCGINMPLFAKTRDMSYAHYDEGLKLAKARNLTAAIEELQIALQINKKNIMARNLLGLCYYAMGRVGEALREWVISVNYGTGDNPAKDYLSRFQDEMQYLDKFSDALHNYNEALQYMLQQSEDLAVIRLKRAIEINPDFVDALNMLALFHIKTGEKGKAGILVERVLDIDNGNPFARRYYREVFQKRAPSGPAKRPAAMRPQIDEPIRSAPSTMYSKPPAQKPERQNPFLAQTQRPAPKAAPIYGLLLFAAGLGAMFLFMYILMIPSLLEDGIAESAALSAELSSRQAFHAEQIAERDEIIGDLQAELATYQQIAAQQDEQNRALQNESWVNTAYSYLSQGLPREALAMLENVDTARLSPDVMSVHSHVLQTARPIVEEEYYQLGQYHFNAGEYVQARENLENAARFVSEESTVAHYVLYLLGREAETREDFSLARSYYDMIINNFPDSNRVNAANTRINQLPELDEPQP